ncbi:hypothetical protein [Texcoconibacillus texcoconensis]|uniref:Uncharacterized protein n=1 Tax=Texcoconibacillus texcoconensis TaxID=1095777 RepID=A0A840QII3_9BACI|nr:hypothetical protein [Texcoconibacillus texcoconensis]MBB5171865.1 hypothetical protein [Texcoconibacillus texcoconensis]
MYSQEEMKVLKERERKKRKIGITIIIVLVVMSFINDRMKYTTFEEVMSERMPDVESIEKIDVRYSIAEDEVGEISFDTEWESREATIENEEFIETFFHESSDIELKEQNRGSSSRTFYYLKLYTDTENYWFHIYEHDLELGRDSYQIIGDNLFYQLLENEDIDWETV